MRPQPPRILTPFWGYPKTLLTHWCQCSATTARLFKSGIRTPSKAAPALFWRRK